MTPDARRGIYQTKVLAIPSYRVSSRARLTAQFLSYDSFQRFDITRDRCMLPSGVGQGQAACQQREDDVRSALDDEIGVRGWAQIRVQRAPFERHDHRVTGHAELDHGFGATAF